MLKKKKIYLVFHKGEVVGTTASKKSAERICKAFFPKNCSFKLTFVV